MSTDSIVFAFSKVSSKDLGKKKKVNRSAKLKQCKLDTHREQWLSQADDKKQELNVGVGVPVERETLVVINETKLPDRGCEVGSLKAECDGAVLKGPVKGHAWRPDDAFRPQTLPTLAKQYSFPMNAERCCGLGAGSWVHGVGSQPTSCPICYEDLDLTDSSFRPCLCGFRLCLFCHKRILEADGRCPGCRKQYESVKGKGYVNGGAPPFRFTSSFSMSTRS